MSLSIEDVEHVAALAKMSLTDEQKESLKVELGNILGYIDQLSEVKTEKVEPYSYYRMAKENVARDDIRQESLKNEEILSNAPDRHEGYFKVRKVIE